MLADYQQQLQGYGFNAQQMSQIASLNLDDPQHPLNVLYLFSPALSKTHPIVIRNGLPEQRVPYISDSGLEYKFPECVRHFVYRFLPMSLRQKDLTYSMMPHIQRKTVGQLTKMLPVVLDQLKDLSLDAAREEREILAAEAARTEEQRRFNDTELLKNRFEVCVTPTSVLITVG